MLLGVVSDVLLVTTTGAIIIRLRDEKGAHCASKALQSDGDSCQEDILFLVRTRQQNLANIAETEIRGHSKKIESLSKIEDKKLFKMLIFGSGLNKCDHFLADVTNLRWLWFHCQRSFSVEKENFLPDHD